ncbi:MAG: 50S ribosomal protein L24 [Actinomycetota bacterium]
MPGLKIRKGDTVEVLSGKDRGKQGRVVNVYPTRAMVMVEGVNQVKRHETVRPTKTGGGMQGGIITKEMPLDISNIAIVCPSCGKPTRVGHQIGIDGKERICRKCGGRI